MIRIFTLGCGWLLIASMASAQQHRIFVQKAGESPVGVPPEGITIEVLDGNDTIVFDAYIEEAPPLQRVAGMQVGVPCAATAGSTGSVSLLSPVISDEQRPDICFAGRYCTAGPNIGFPCTLATALANCGAAGLCGPQNVLAATEDGDCAGDGIPFPRASVSHGFTQPAIYISTPCYVGTFAYQITADALGIFEIEIPNEPQSISRDHNDENIPFMTSGATINVPAGRCCNGGACLGEMNSIACANLGGVFSVGQTCADFCCAGYSDCDDDNVCTFDTCDAANCSSHTVRFGDTNGSGGIIDIDDLLCINNGFANIVNCPNADIVPNCTGNDIIDLDDILSVIIAFGGADPCGCN